MRTAEVRIAPGAVEAAYRALLDRAAEERWLRRLHERDASLWSDAPAVRRAIEHRLGWLKAPEASAGALDDLRAWAAEVAEDSDAAVLLGMGGSSLAPEVMVRALAPSFRVTGRLRPALFVLDTTNADAVGAAADRLDPARTLHFVSSKSGTTIETASLAAVFRERVRAAGLSGAEAGRRFVAITDPGTPLEALARDLEYRRTFLADATVGGRYSALTPFGLAPAAVADVPVEAVVARGRAALRDHGPDRRASDAAAVRLGCLLAAAAAAGRDKMTLLFSEPLEPLGAWIEQLVAESTGKEGKGLLPVDGEPLGDPASYGADRLFVATTLAGVEDETFDAPLEALAAAGHPVVEIVLPDASEIGGEFVRWEIATAIAAAGLRVNPFDEPDVRAAKDATAEVLEAFERDRRLPGGPDEKTHGPPFTVARVHVDSARRPDYVAFLVYLPPSRDVEVAFRRIRHAVRDRLGVATTFGYGPRYLHSTGQVHKGGPPTGVFVQVTCDPRGDVEVPGRTWTLATLHAAQAAGDFAALKARGRRVVRCHLGADVAAGLAALEAALI